MKCPDCDHAMVRTRYSTYIALVCPNCGKILPAILLEKFGGW